MNSMELVSAIITTHNRKPEMVVRAVKSVLRQTYKNIEIIIVDDSSPDFIQRKTVENSVCSLSDKIVYIKNDVCQGACAARNTGLKYAHGEYVGFLDDDDEWRYDKIEKQLAAFTDDSIAMVYSGILYVDEVNRRKFYEDNQYEKGKMFELLLRSNIIGSTSNPLIKKQCINDVGGFDVSMQSSQDYDLWIRIARKYQINYVDAPLLKYHIHSGYRITEDAGRKSKGLERLIYKNRKFLNRDDEAWYLQNTRLVYYYALDRKRKKALSLWCACVKKMPKKIISNINLLIFIAIRFDIYETVRKRLAPIYHKIKDDLLVKKKN